MFRCLFVAVCFFISASPVFAADFIVPIPESTPSSPLTIDLSLSELPQVRLTPESPFFFLKILWEKVCLLAKRFPRDKALLALDYSQRRLSEAFKISIKEINWVMIERLFRERRRLFEKAYQLAGDDAEVGREISRQLALGKRFLENLSGRVSFEASPSAFVSSGLVSPTNVSRAENLLRWREEWVGAMPVEILERSELTEPTKGVLEATAVASLEESASGRPGFLEKILNFIFGSRPIFSPLAEPGSD